MKITFLGTGAADWPEKKPEGCKEHRRLSSALIDGSLLIDPNPCVFDALNEYSKDPSEIKYIINTHRHSDHFDEKTVAKLEKYGARFIPFSEGEEKTVGKYTVSAYRANHSTVKDPVHFIISDGEKTVFYGLDGAWLLFDEVQAIKNRKPDFAVFDATVGFIDGDYRIFEHNDLNMVLEMKKTLEKYIGKFCISHMARTLHTDHATLSGIMEKHGVTVASDGLEIEI
jgi:phosphoribosyl 1,2-cyclic phosphate phosphodiesterase